MHDLASKLAEANIRLEQSKLEAIQSIVSSEYIKWQGNIGSREQFILFHVCENPDDEITSVQIAKLYAFLDVYSQAKQKGAKTTIKRIVIYLYAYGHRYADYVAEMLNLKRPDGSLDEGELYAKLEMKEQPISDSGPKHIVSVNDETPMPNDKSSDEVELVSAFVQDLYKSPEQREQCACFETHDLRLKRAEEEWKSKYLEKLKLYAESLGIELLLVTDSLAEEDTESKKMCQRLLEGYWDWRFRGQKVSDPDEVSRYTNEVFCFRVNDSNKVDQEGLWSQVNKEARKKLECLRKKALLSKESESTNTGVSPGKIPKKEIKTEKLKAIEKAIEAFLAIYLIRNLIKFAQFFHHPESFVPMLPYRLESKLSLQVSSQAQVSLSQRFIPLHCHCTAHVWLNSPSVSLEFILRRIGYGVLGRRLPLQLSLFEKKQSPHISPEHAAEASEIATIPPMLLGPRRARSNSKGSTVSSSSTEESYESPKGIRPVKAKNKEHVCRNLDEAGLHFVHEKPGESGEISTLALVESGERSLEKAGKSTRKKEMVSEMLDLAVELQDCGHRDVVSKLVSCAKQLLLAPSPTPSVSDLPQLEQGSFTLPESYSESSLFSPKGKDRVVSQQEKLFDKLPKNRTRSSI